jgi:hypothetical protein
MIREQGKRGCVDYRLINLPERPIPEMLKQPFDRAAVTASLHVRYCC